MLSVRSSSKLGRKLKCKCLPKKMLVLKCIKIQVISNHSCRFYAPVKYQNCVDDSALGRNRNGSKLLLAEISSGKCIWFRSASGFAGNKSTVCLGFYDVSTVFQFFNDHSSQIHVSWTIFIEYLTSPLSWNRRVSRSAIPIILSAKDEIHYYQFKRLWAVAAGDWTHGLNINIHWKSSILL